MSRPPGYVFCVPVRRLGGGRKSGRRQHFLLREAILYALHLHYVRPQVLQRIRELRPVAERRVRLQASILATTLLT